jgi:hypothetical protein
MVFGLYFFGYMFVNPYWFPPVVQKYILPFKFSEGDCIKSPRMWGVNPKRVFGYKIKQNESFYLLKDLDRYEDFQYISKHTVEKHAEKSSCRL